MVTPTGPIRSLRDISLLEPAEVPAVPLRKSTEHEDPDVTELSRLGAVLSQLTDLQRTDPELAHRALLAMASDLSGRATRSGGDAQLRALADAFARAAQSGDLSEVRPLVPLRPDDAIEGADLHTATAQRQAASYAQTEPPLRPDLQSLLEDALSRATAEPRTADRAAHRRTDPAESEQRSADRAEHPK
jgi:hypothetical protein